MIAARDSGFRRRREVGEVSAVFLAQAGETLALAAQVRRRPFGPLESLVHGNDLAWGRAHDLDGLPTRETLAGLRDQTHAHDPAGRLQSLADKLDPSQSQTFAYDATGRLSAAVGGYGSLGYTYGPDGERLAETRDGAATTYAQGPGNRLQATAGASGQAYAHDAVGNTVRAGPLEYAYGPGGRLRQVSQGGAVLAQYAYDPLGRRLAKTAGGAATYFLHGPGGELLAELDADGSPRAEHVWLDGAPLAVLQGGQAYHVHPDRLGSPRLITDAAGTPLWRWDGDPFGATPADEDPDGDGTPFVYNLRFPGQYFDAETGLHYNMARYYDPATGQYRESDPIGLGGGINTYAYVRNNPVNRTDQTGLFDEGGEDDGDGGTGKTCRLIFKLLAMPAIDILGGSSETWYCVYNCNSVCPGKIDNIITRVFYLPKHMGGCPKYINKNDLFPDDGPYHTLKPL